MDFALSSNPSQSQVADAINYLLGNLGGSSAQYNPVTGTITQNGVVIGYIYRYLWVKYATSFNGTTGFSDSPTNATYYGLANSDSNVELTDPTRYAWTPATFGSTNLLWFLTTGGRKLTISVASVQPATGWSSDTGTAIDLDQISAVAGSIINTISNQAALGMDGQDGEDGLLMLITKDNSTVLGGFTVAGLPAAGIAGRRAYVTNALAPAFGAAVVGGGAVVIPVFDNGVAWIAG